MNTQTPFKDQNPAYDPIRSISSAQGINYLFPQRDSLPKGSVSNLPITNGKKLEPINKRETTDNKTKSSMPDVDKDFFSFFTLSNYNIPIGVQKASIELEEDKSDFESRKSPNSEVEVEVEVEVELEK